MENAETAIPFLWGVATSAHQIEGYNEFNDWWQWEEAGNIEGGVRSGSACDHWNKYQEDLKLAKELGVNAYRFSIEWSRVEPEPGKPSKSAIDFYRSLIAECESLGLIPMATLHHFTSPQWFAKRGAFSRPNTKSEFIGFVDHIVTKLGAHIPYWCTINEPNVLIAGGYLGKFMPPAKFSPKHAARATRQLLKCHGIAYKLIHDNKKKRKGPFKHLPTMVGTAHNFITFVPERLWHPIENYLCRLLHHYYNMSWIDALVGKKQNIGVPFFIPKMKPIKTLAGKRTIDFIGLNYYTKCYLRWRPLVADKHMPAEVPLSIHHARPFEKKSDLDWAINPQGLAHIIKELKKYNLPIIITENGLADRDDKHRSQFIEDHIDVMLQEKKNGADIRGYFHWSLMDNFEWIHGFGPRFGLYEVDYETQQRSPRQSASTYRSIIEKTHF